MATATKPRARRSTARSEDEIHRNLVSFLLTARGQLPKLHFCKHTPNEAVGGGPIVERMYKGKLSRVPLSVLQNAQRGVVAGVWDFEYLGINESPINHKPAGWYRGLAIELKHQTDLSDEQILWQQHYELNGWHTRIFREWHLAAAYLVRWVGGDPAQFEGLEDRH